MKILILSANSVFINDVLLSIASKYNKRVVQVILCWLTQRGIVAISITVLKERMIEDFNIFDFELSSEDLNLIASLDTQTSSFFDNRDHEIVKWLGNRKLDI